ncbi:MAG: hypothetical protein ACRD3Q_17275 [Terriglobales bacterium]
MEKGPTATERLEVSSNRHTVAPVPEIEIVHRQTETPIASTKDAIYVTKASKQNAPKWKTVTRERVKSALRRFNVPLTVSLAH